MIIYRIAAALFLACVLDGCAADSVPSDMGKLPTETTVPEKTVYESAEVIKSCPLSDLPSEKITYSDCIALNVPKRSVREVIAEEKCGELTVCVISVGKNGVYAAVAAEENYIAFHEIHAEGTDEYVYRHSIQIVLFSDVFGKSGLHLSYGVGANYGAEMYFIFESDSPVLLLSCSHRDSFHEDILVENGSWGVTSFCCMQDNGLYRYYLDMSRIFSAEQYRIPIPPFYLRDQEYEGHKGIFTLQAENKETGETEEYVGWLDQRVLFFAKKPN